MPTCPAFLKEDSQVVKGWRVAPLACLFVQLGCPAFILLNTPALFIAQPQVILGGTVLETQT